MTPQTPQPASGARALSLRRTTTEVDVELKLNVDGSGRSRIDTGLPFLDHLLDALARHARFDLELTARGDTHIDDHHTAEDCAIALGRALLEVVQDRRGLARFGFAFAPLDEALARTVVDLSGRPWAEIDLGLVRETIGTVATENLTHFLTTLALEGRFALHVRMLSGANDHHRAEAAFKSTALALRAALAREGGLVPSTKGVLG